MIGFLKNLFGLNYDRSPEWPSVRKEHIKKQPFCQGCGKTSDLQVHHIVPVHVDKTKELDPNNLITLCGRYCHLAIGHLMDTSSWNTNVVEDAQIFFEKVKNRPYKK